jgi:hypothetical protein
MMLPREECAGGQAGGAGADDGDALGVWAMHGRWPGPPLKRARLCYVL